MNVLKKFLIMFSACLIVISNALGVLASGESWGLGQEAGPVALEGVSGALLSSFSALQWIGYLVAIGMIMWVGIRYLLSAAGEKAKAKEMLMPMFIGAFLVVAATSIAAAIFNI